MEEVGVEVSVVVDSFEGGNGEGGDVVDVEFDSLDEVREFNFEIDVVNIVGSKNKVFV